MGMLLGQVTSDGDGDDAHQQHNSPVAEQSFYTTLEKKTRPFLIRVDATELVRLEVVERGLIFAAAAAQRRVPSAGSFRVRL